MSKWFKVSKCIPKIGIIAELPCHSTKASEHRLYDYTSAIMLCLDWYLSYCQLTQYQFNEILTYFYFYIHGEVETGLGLIWQWAIDRLFVELCYLHSVWDAQIVWQNSYNLNDPLPTDTSRYLNYIFAMIIHVLLC